MAFDTHSLFGFSNVAAVTSQTGGTAIFNVTPGDGTKFASSNQNIVIWPANTNPTKSNAMVTRITGNSSDTLTVSYPQEGSSTVTIVAGMQIANTVTPKVLTDIESQVTTNTTNIATNTTNIAANTANISSNTSSISTINSKMPAGAIVGTTDTQTLTNKSIDASEITTGTMATARLGSGTANSTTYLRGDQTWATTSSSSRTDGWTADTNTWVYVSASSFKVSGVDVTAQFPKGTRVAWTEGATWKYGVVGSSSFSTDTTVNLIANSDYSMTNTTITNNIYSYQANPQGYPYWFNFSPTYTGFSTAPSGGACKFSVIGNILTIHHNRADGTSNASGFTMTVPITTATGDAHFMVSSKDNGGWSNAWFYLGVGQTSATIFKTTDQSGNIWTTSGAKSWFGYVYYEF